jgi:hypothetical protein
VDNPGRELYIATDGVFEECVSAIDNDVAGLKTLGKLVDNCVGAGTGLHHDDCGPWLRESRDKLIDCLGCDKPSLGVILS